MRGGVRETRKRKVVRRRERLRGWDREEGRCEKVEEGLGGGAAEGGEMRGQRAQGADDMMGSLPGGPCAAPTRSARGSEDLR